MLGAAVVYTVCNLIVMIGMLLGNNIMMFVAMIVMVLFFGVTYSIVNSIYPA
jgi:hypothetical protein